MLDLRNQGMPVRDTSLQVDLFGRLRVGQPFSLFDSKLIFDAQNTRWDDAQVSGSGTSVFHDSNRASALLSVSDATVGRRVRQSKYRPYYQPGKCQSILITTIVGDAPHGITKRWGYFDDKNGLFFQNKDGVLYVCKRSYTSGAPIDEYIPQSAWNKEKLDGNTSLGVRLDPTKGNIYFISFEWLGLGDVQFGVIIDTQMIILHQMKHSNTENKVYMSTPNLPVRFEIANDGTGPASSIEAVCSSVTSDGGIQPTGYIRSIDRGVSLFNTDASTKVFPLIAIRLKPGREGALVVPMSFDIVCTTSGPFRWSLLLNPTLTGTSLTWEDSAFSFQHTGATTTNATYITNEGTVVLSGYGIDKGSAINQIEIPISFILGTSIQGTSDIYVLAVNSTTDKVNSFYASMTVREVY